MHPIPLVDISSFTTGEAVDADARKAAAQNLSTVVHQYGCAAICGHGLPQDVLAHTFAMMKDLFGLPIEEKMKAPHPDGPRPHRGYLAKTIERSGRLGAILSEGEDERMFLTQSVDWKETYDVGHEDNAEEENIWLPDDVLPGFREHAVQLYDQLTKVATAILDALIMGLDVSVEDGEVLKKAHDPKINQFRLAHYLPMDAEVLQDPNKIRLAPHKDISKYRSYTLLFQEPSAASTGLEFQNPQTGAFDMPAKAEEGILYLNIGMIFERFTNGFYPAAMHRVAIPTDDNAGTSTYIPGRLSIPFFCRVWEEQVIYPLPSLVERNGRAPVAEPVKSQDMVTQLFNRVIVGAAA